MLVPDPAPLPPNHVENKMKDWEQSYTDAANEILQEAERARAKFAPFNSSHEGYAVLAEEVDELWDDVKANNIDHAIEEAVQVGAMALRFIADMRAKQVVAHG